ncbi:L-fucose/L-arabinose isomerase family protein [Haloferula sp.]|uniref:L-fucose/L-arabinose isomerase family protein n=1 Tax=Haloferula sp. TaxID=2497595 RepID=UPI003C781FFE
MSKSQPKLAFCPIGKFVFSHEDALHQKEEIRKVMAAIGADYVDLENVLPDGIVRDKAHVRAVVEHFRATGAEALFIPHCNFGTEDAAALIARDLGLPVLLWGPRDEAPLADGSRLRDTLCGLLPTSKVLGKLGVPFSYIPNCRTADPEFKEGLLRFLGAAHAANALRMGCRIGLIGQRIDFFWSTICNESELLERFRIEVVQLDMVDFINAVKARAAGGYHDEIRQLRGNCVVEEMDDTALAGVLAVRDEALALAERHQLDAMACQSFMSLPESIGAWAVFADSMIGDKLPFVLESDICGAVSTLLAQRAALGRPAFLTDIAARHPQDDNAVLLWHCGAPLAMKHPDEKVRLGKHWILPGPLSGMTHFRMQDGPITCVRFDGEHGSYAIGIGEGESCDGPSTLNNYAWMRVHDWTHWERTLIEGPFLHHIAMTYTHCGAALKEAARFIPDLKIYDMDSKQK